MKAFALNHAGVILAFGLGAISSQGYSSYPECLDSGFPSIESLDLSPIAPCFLSSASGPIEPPPKDIREWLKSHGDPILRNLAITLNYHYNARALNQYIGGPPTYPNWWAFGQNASSLAGEMIRSLQDGLKILSDLRNSNPFEISTRVGELQKMALRPGVVGNSLRIVLEEVETLLASPSGTSLNAFKSAIEQKEQELRQLYGGMVAGNYFIYEEVGSLMSAFLMAVSTAPDCRIDVETLRTQQEWERTDPKGILREALRKYQAARSEKDPARKKQLVYEANLLVGFQEQMMIQQRVFDRNGLGRLMAPFRNAIRDGVGTYTLIDGNWSVFPLRMGFRSLDRPGEPMGQGEFERRFGGVGARSTLTPELILKLLADGTISDRPDHAGTVPAYFRNRMERGEDQRKQMLRAPSVD